MSVTDPFTESDRSRSAAYRQRVQKLNRIAGLSQLGIVGVAAFVAYHLQLSQKLEPYLWWSPLIVAIVVLGIASSAPGVITGSWLALVVNRQVGLSFAKARSWWRKTLRSWAVGIAYTLITGVCLWTAIRYATPWWVFAWVVLAGNVAVRYGVLAPLLLRAGNKTMPVPQSVLRTIETLSSQIGIRAPRSMIVSIESRTAPNASITGIGPFQRLMITEPAVSLPDVYKRQHKVSLSTRLTFSAPRCSTSFAPAIRARILSRRSQISVTTRQRPWVYRDLTFRPTPPVCQT